MSDQIIKLEEVPVPNAVAAAPEAPKSAMAPATVALKPAPQASNKPVAPFAKYLPMFLTALSKRHPFLAMFVQILYDKLNNKNHQDNAAKVKAEKEVLENLALAPEKVRAAVKETVSFLQQEQLTNKPLAALDLAVAKASAATLESSTPQQNISKTLTGLDLANTSNHKIKTRFSALTDEYASARATYDNQAQPSAVRFTTALTTTLLKDAVAMPEQAESLAATAPKKLTMD